MLKVRKSIILEIGINKFQNLILWFRFFELKPKTLFKIKNKKPILS